MFILSAGGITYRWNAEDNDIQQTRLDQTAYNQRQQLLTELLIAINYPRQLSETELNSIIYRGHFEYQNHRYEFNPFTRHFEQQDMDAQTFERHLANLDQQLVQIGCRNMSQVERHHTINTHVFHYNGGDWIYQFDTEQYVPATAAADGTFTPETTYSVPAITEAAPVAEPAEVLPTPMASSTTRPQTINRNRGDQPPQAIDDDYSTEEEVIPVQPTVEPALEQEPGVGYYPVEPAVGNVATESSQSTVPPSGHMAQPEKEQDPEEEYEVLENEDELEEDQEDQE